MLEQFLSYFIDLLEFLAFLEYQSEGLDEHVGCIVQVELADSLEFIRFGFVLKFWLS